MRVASLVVLALVSVALLGTGATTPLACVDSCRVDGHGQAGFIAPVTEVASGGSLSWGALDGGSHVNVDGGPGDDADPCFGVFYSGLAPSDAVRFDIVDGALFATTGGETFECLNARALADGSFALPYYCILHPALMRGVILVTP